MSTKELALPSSVTPSTWSADTAAMMEFAGLTWFEGVGDNCARQFAPSGIMAGFIAACSRTGLDPTAKQIYAAQMGGKWTVLVGVDGMRLVAQRTGQYDGQDPIEWQAVEDGPWSQTPGKGSPYAARISIYRKGVSRPIVQTVTLAEFGGKGGNWSTRPAHMLGIRAETHAFRRLFPMELSGLYTAEDFESGTVDAGDMNQVEPTENWAALIEAATTKEALTEIRDRAVAAQEYGGIRGLVLAKIGKIGRAPEQASSEPVVDDEEEAIEGELMEDPAPPAAPAEMTEAEFERQSAAEFDAEVQP